jgi:two-component system chemotaxis response regulator CheB
MRDVVVIGASAGGVEALQDLVRELPADLPAAVLIVLHLPTDAHSSLPGILARNGRLPTLTAESGMTLEQGRIFVAPPNRHLVLVDGSMQLVAGPRENGVRPAIDPLFRSAAKLHGSRTVGVVLSGTLDDGSSGLMAVKSAGGMTIVQSPDDALFPSMPECAILAASPEHVLAASEIGRLLPSLVREEAESTSRNVPAELR